MIFVTICIAVVLLLVYRCLYPFSHRCLYCCCTAVHNAVCIAARGDVCIVVCLAPSSAVCSSVGVVLSIVMRFAVCISVCTAICTAVVSVEMGYPEVRCGGFLRLCVAVCCITTSTPSLAPTLRTFLKALDGR